MISQLIVETWNHPTLLAAKNLSLQSGAALVVDRLDPVGVGFDHE
jgi:hypothetical protein